MSSAQSTCWTVIQAAAAGSREDREQFVLRYASIVRAYLAARWRQSACAGELEDAVQDVFVDCFKPDGVLGRVDPARGGGFRAFLYGVVRVVALRLETRRARDRHQQAAPDMPLEEVADSEQNLAEAFDRAWARALVREAAQLQAERAAQDGPAALRRVELLQLRFHDNLPIRDIAVRWQCDAGQLHHDYARARQEFKAALLEVMAFHHPGTPAAIEQECANLLLLWQ
jgi:RNA polymerase sigma-70 factor (ECF subfamily)